MLDQLDEIETLSSDDSQTAAYTQRTKPSDIVDVYLDMVNNYNKYVKPILNRLNPDLAQKIENNVFNTAFHHFVYYLGCKEHHPHTGKRMRRTDLFRRSKLYNTHPQWFRRYL